MKQFTEYHTGTIQRIKYGGLALAAFAIALCDLPAWSQITNNSGPSSVRGQSSTTRSNQSSFGSSQSSSFGSSRSSGSRRSSRGSGFSSGRSNFGSGSSTGRGSSFGRSSMGRSSMGRSSMGSRSMGMGSQQSLRAGSSSMGLGGRMTMGRGGSGRGQMSISQQNLGNIPDPPFLIKMDPALIVVEPDETFLTTVNILDIKDLPYESVRFSLTYNPQVLEVVELDTSHLDEILAEPADIEHNRQSGRINYQAHFSVEQEQPRGLLNIKWKPIGEAIQTTIRFDKNPDLNSIVSNSEEMNYLGEGIVNWLISFVQVRVRERIPNPKSPVLFDTEGEYYAKTFSGNVMLQPVGPPPPPGELWKVDVYLKNPEKTAFQDLAMTLNYDPQRLTVVDYDKGNTIRRGVNLWDGFSQDAFPFTRHVRNTAELTGKIYYEKGFDEPTAPESGPFARIFFAVLAPTSAEDIGIERLNIR